MREVYFGLRHGGAVDDGETYEQAVARELKEELDITVTSIGPMIWGQNLELKWKGEPFISHEQYYYLALDVKEISLTGMSSSETTDFIAYRWWDLADIIDSKEEFSPRNMGNLVKQLLTNGLPEKPILIRG